MTGALTRGAHPLRRRRDAMNASRSASETLTERPNRCTARSPSAIQRRTWRSEWSSFSAIFRTVEKPDPDRPALWPALFPLRVMMVSPGLRLGARPAWNPPPALIASPGGPGRTGADGCEVVGSGGEGGCLFMSSTCDGVPSYLLRLVHEFQGEDRRSQDSRSSPRTRNLSARRIDQSNGSRIFGS